MKLPAWWRQKPNLNGMAAELQNKLNQPCC
jgi:hypothetical protein